jgi:AcrR family transcriptional regulator
MYNPGVPIDVDVRERLTQIAKATLEVIRERGAEGVTLRAVARQLGGSTTLVTNYLPTRTALLRNAVQHSYDNWAAELTEQVAGVPKQERLGAIVAWSCGTEPGDEVLRQLFIELVGRSGSDNELADMMEQDSVAEQEELLEAATQAGAADPAFAADVLHLLLRGFYLASLETPEAWTSERVRPLAARLVELLTRET